jgi:hypothetical protein
MKDRLLFGTIGLLLGIVVMQWTMPTGHATIVTDPAGNIVATMGSRVLGADGNVWYWNQQSGWTLRHSLPVPLSDVRFIQQDNDWGTAFVDKDGNYWLDNSTTPEGVFVNHGQPPIEPLATEQSTWGQVKSQFKGKER